MIKVAPHPDDEFPPEEIERRMDAGIRALFQRGPEQNDELTGRLRGKRKRRQAATKKRNAQRAKVVRAAREEAAVTGQSMDDILMSWGQAPRRKPRIDEHGRPFKRNPPWRKTR